MSGNYNSPSELQTATAAVASPAPEQLLVPGADTDRARDQAIISLWRCQCLVSGDREGEMGLLSCYDLCYYGHKLNIVKMTNSIAV